MSKKLLNQEMINSHYHFIVFPFNYGNGYIEMPLHNTELYKVT